MFQSTPSGGKATLRQCGSAGWLCVSIHAFRGEGDAVSYAVPLTEEVSIHAFRGEGDYSIAAVGFVNSMFQSTPSGGKATVRRRPPDAAQRRFNPRLPGGRRQRVEIAAQRWRAFQSTPSGGKATRFRRSARLARIVSIHAFRGEGDEIIRQEQERASLFQSTPSGGKATTAPTAWTALHTFQSTPSGGKATGGQRQCRVSTSFQSTPSGGKATRVRPACSTTGRQVSIHAFRGEGDEHEALRRS